MITKILDSVVEVYNDFITGVDLKTIITVIIIIMFGWIALKINKTAFKYINKNQAMHLKFAKSIVSAIIMVYTIYQAGTNIPGLQGFMTTVVASTSLLVVVAGFAAQEALSNIINGLVISIFKPFEIGDRVSIVSKGITGYIEDISLRHTILKTFTNSRIIIPNSVLNKEMIENSHFKDNRASMWIDISASFDSDITLAKQLIVKVIESHPLYLDTRTEEEIANGVEKVTVSVREIGTSGVALRANVWTLNVDDNFVACSDIREELIKQFREHNIHIPCNKLDLTGEVKFI